MAASQLAYLVLLLAAGSFVCVAAYWDVREKRIPNRFTLPMFSAGCVYQLILSLLDGWHHLGSGVCGFLIGFGVLFLLWFVGSGGGGDVKLMGALGIWLGGWMTLQVLMATLLIILSIILARRCADLLTSRSAAGSTTAIPSTSIRRDQKVERRLMTFAGPVAIATWAILLLAPWISSHSTTLNPLQKSVVQQVQN